MAVTIQSQEASVTINEHGAELVSFIGKTSGMEYMWSADQSYWGRHAPVLFPIVGRLKDDTYYVDGQEYKMSQHGFARDLDFEIINSKENAVVLELHSSNETKKMYPFDFILRLSYELNGKSLKVAYEVENPSNESIWFGIGGHPAFKIPLTNKNFYDDYTVKLVPQTTRNLLPLRGSYVDINHLKEERTSQIMVNRETFKDDAVILDLGEEPTTIELSDDKAEHGVVMRVSDAKYLGVWSCYPKNGQFVCLEPWWGIADTVNTDQDFKHKFASNHLEAHQKFNAGYELSIF